MMIPFLVSLSLVVGGMFGFVLGGVLMSRKWRDNHYSSWRVWVNRNAFNKKI
jgi:hypothetical protein